MSSMNLNELTITEAIEGLRNEQFTSVELTQACLDRIDARNKEVNAFITVCKDEALAQAKEADQRIAAGEATLLTGIPYGVKDAICTKGIRSTGAAKILDNYIPPYHATVIQKLEDAGAVMIGKQNCDSFGHGASNEGSMYGPVKNPHDESKVAGGSSGGSAAALADHQCLFSIAEDTGGSIRQPASFCGVVGLRPSYGRNSRYGIMPMGSSLDTVGPMAKTVEDLALIQQVLAGHDDKDATTVPDPVPDYSAAIGNDVKGLKIGVPEEYFHVEGADEEVMSIVRAQIDKLKEQGAEIIPVTLPHTKYAIPTYYIIVPCEDSSNLGRLDGIRYGVRADGSKLEEVYGKSREQGFPAEIKRRIMIGTYALSAGYYDAYYRKAQRVRTLIRQDFEDVFTKVDVLVAPTSPFPAFGLGEKQDDVLAMYLSDALVSPASLAGVPGLSVPAGKTRAGLPVGLQIIGPRLGESSVLAVGSHIRV